MRIIHVFRTPVGGLFRHVRDLVRGQGELGHQVGIICDSSSGGEQATRLLDSIKLRCELGIHRFPVSRLPGLGDIGAIWRSHSLLKSLDPDIVHGHGAKGGLYGRLSARLLGVPSVYSPHGGSLHFDWSNPGGAAFLSAEVIERRIGHGLLFVCDYERRAFEAKIGVGDTPNAVVYNGLWPEEFEPVEPAPNATDLVYVGELRKLKGIDVLIEAMVLLRQKYGLSATIVGDGADRREFEAMAAGKGLAQKIRFFGSMPARKAFSLGRLLVMPSRAESFPYIILETLAAQLPVLATCVGGIPEILPERSLVAAGNPAALANAIEATLRSPEQARQAAKVTASRVAKRYSAIGMVKQIDEFYHNLKLA
jgi:glycosyltransferase involved in cell wall biosynthesis